MHDPGGMSSRETLGRVLQVAQQLSQIRARRMNLLAQRHAIDKFHRDVMDAFLFTYLVNCRNARMIERRRRLRFLFKSPHAVFVYGEFGRQNLQRNFPVQPSVFCQVHLAHSTCANLRADFVATESCAGTKSHYLVVIRHRGQSL